MKAKFLDSLYVGLLILYVMAGITRVPFHGDESLILYMSRDWYYFTHDTRYMYENLDGDLALQELRILNGPLAVFMIGAAWQTAGFSVDQLNSQYDWSGDPEWNRQNGHMPSDVLLFAARMPSVLCTSISVALVFALGKLLSGRRTAWVAALVFTLTPAVVLNGRRSVFEGAFIVTSLLLLFMACKITRDLNLKPNYIHSRDWLLLGAAAGLTVCAKHTGLLLVVPTFGVLFLLGWRYYANLWRMLLLPVAGIIALAVFWVLNPAWWMIPLKMPALVMERRQQLLNYQVQIIGGYTTAGERVTGMINAVLGPPSYFEANPAWEGWIGDEIKAYESLWLGGVWGIGIGLIKAVLAIAGLWWCIRHFAKRHVAAFTIITLSVTAAIFMLNPLSWPRYYLPVMLPFALLCGLGLHWLVEKVIPFAAYSSRLDSLRERGTINP